MRGGKSHLFSLFQEQITRSITRKFEVPGYRKCGGCTTIDYRHEKGGTGAIPLAWTDADQADPFLNISQGRSVFRVAELRSSGTLNRNPQRVSDPLFSGHAFFDAQDLVQIKYEMLRRPPHRQCPPPRTRFSVAPHGLFDSVAKCV